MDRSQSNKAENTAKQMDKPKTAKWSMNFWRDAARKKPQKGTHDPSGGEATADGGAPRGSQGSTPNGFTPGPVEILVKRLDIEKKNTRHQNWLKENRECTRS